MVKLEAIGAHDSQSWDSQLKNLGISSPFHTWDSLNYAAVGGNAENRSFLLLNDQGQYLAVCPFFVETIESGGRKFRSLSTRGAPAPSPLIVRLGDENRVRRDLRLMEQVLKDLYRQFGLSKVSYVCRSYYFFNQESACFETQGLLDLLSLGYMPTVFQSVTVDLRVKEDQLWSELSQYHRKEIRKAKESGQIVRIFDASSVPAELNNAFFRFQDQHTKAAGSKARPQDSFDVMRRMIVEGKAALFVNTFHSHPVSYLYCGHRNGIAYGSMQVNVPESPVRAPRHLTEWEAIIYYRGSGCFLYDIGVRFTRGQFGAFVDDKLKSIGFYKERFGGVLAPEIHYSKYLDRKLLETEWKLKVEQGTDDHIC